jgi:hypothetical protein
MGVRQIEAEIEGSSHEGGLAGRPNREPQGRRTAAYVSSENEPEYAMRQRKVGLIFGPHESTGTNTFSFAKPLATRRKRRRARLE